jgi:hypothetical protein
MLIYFCSYAIPIRHLKKCRKCHVLLSSGAITSSGSVRAWRAPSILIPSIFTTWVTPNILTYMGLICSRSRGSRGPLCLGDLPRAEIANMPQGNLAVTIQVTGPHRHTSSARCMQACAPAKAQHYPHVDDLQSDPVLASILLSTTRLCPYPFARLHDITLPKLLYPRMKWASR